MTTIASDAHISVARNRSDMLCLSGTTRDGSCGRLVISTPPSAARLAPRSVDVIGAGADRRPAKPRE
jgi:hypothetical protein